MMLRSYKFVFNFFIYFGLLEWKKILSRFNNNLVECRTFLNDLISCRYTIHNREREKKINQETKYQTIHVHYCKLLFSLFFNFKIRNIWRIVLRTCILWFDTAIGHCNRNLKSIVILLYWLLVKHDLWVT